MVKKDIRKSKYDKPTVIQAVLDGMTIGNLSCYKACVAAGVPDATFLLWVNEDKDLAERYARAREGLIERMANDLLEIADEPVGTTVQGSVDSGAVAKQRLQIDTRKWLLSKLAPKKYGDKVEVDHSGAVTFSQITRQVIDPLTIDQSMTEKK